MAFHKSSSEDKEMNTIKRIILMFIFSTTFAFTAAQATDSAKEQRIAAQISDFLLTGKIQWLNADKESFLSIYTPAYKHPAGALIFLHGRGMHPDWPKVIHPLRSQFPSKGWATLSLQMPVLQHDATDKDYLPTFKEVPARIQAALDFLSNKGISNIVLIGHNLGANMATHYLVKNHDPRIKAFVGIGMKGKLQPAKYAPLDNVASILQMQIPVLDIYGSKSNPAILASVDRRAFAIASYQSSISTRRSRIIKINDANHFFQGYEDELLKVIKTWISKIINMQTQTNQFVKTNHHLQIK